LTSCDRAGCYELFCLSRRSPGQRFCGKSCRRAVERVRERERRWRERAQEE
jgi:predicted nucleic acid-binding Zn ribbon protein